LTGIISDIETTAYVIANQMNLAQGLQAPADLAPRLGLPDGLEGWEKPAQQLQRQGD